MMNELNNQWKEEKKIVNNLQGNSSINILNIPSHSCFRCFVSLLERKLPSSTHFADKHPCTNDVHIQKFF